MFNNFTNLYSLSKTLRFELKPVGNTQQMLEDNQVFQKDKNKQKAYKEIKPYFDRLHREFVDEALANANLNNLNEYYKDFKAYKHDKKNKPLENKIKARRETLRKEIVEFFDNKAKDWSNQKYKHLQLKNKDLGVLFEENVFQILKEKYGSEKETTFTVETTGEVVSIFDNWKGFVGYFDKFFATRKNLYVSKDDSTAIATRIVDQNFERFLDNLTVFNTIKDKLNILEVEEFFGLKAEDVFTVEFYNKCLLQNGIDLYNDFLGGKTLENGEKKKGMNEIINKYRQDNKGEKLPFLKKLDKQILSEKETGFFVLEKNEDALVVLKDFRFNAENKLKVLQTLIQKFTAKENSFNLEKVYISKEGLNTIVHKWTNETNLFQASLYTTLKESKLVKPKGKNDEEYFFPEFISLSHIQSSLDRILTENKFWKDKYYIESGEEGFLNRKEPVWNGFMQILKFEFDQNFKNFDQKNALLKVELENENLNLQSIKVLIKEFADSALWTYQLGKYFALEKKRAWDETYEVEDFYTDPEIGYKEVYYPNAYDQIVKPYNDLRNFLTKKPYSEEKWKLNFENPTLADGWDKNKESDNFAVILRKEGKYFLGLMKKGNNKIFDDRNREMFKVDNGIESYEKLVYKLFPDPSKMMPKVCFSKKGLDFFKPSSEIIDIYNNDEFKKGETFSLVSMQKLISFYIDCLSKYEGWKDYDFKDVKKPEEYTNNIGEFYADVAKAGYEIRFDRIAEEYINSKNQSGELFLFQIYNQDFSENSTGTKNLHTMYFQELFSQNNSDNNFPFKLNGQAELFYRPKTKDFKKKSIVTNKNKIELSKGERAYEKNRYTDNKIFFHVPITLNRISKNVSRFNLEINNFLANNPGINIIGVDRGEKHLAYYSVINQKGNIIESGSLNSVKGGNNEIIDYHNKLEEKAKGREQARHDWQDVQGIKDLKKGYISQVVRKLADLAIEHNAIVVMEDLNMRFKQIRGGIEKSVYQQLEKALIEKFNFLVNKGEKNPEQAGHLLNAYQLTAPFESFQLMGKQTGIIFYTQASYTSKIDPVSGWRPNLYLKYTSAQKAKEDILKFKDIKFKNNRFSFTYDLKDFVNSKEYPQKTEWTLCSSVERFRWDKTLNNNKGGYMHFKNLTEEYKKLFNEFGFDFEGDIKEQINNLEINSNEKFFRNFIFFFNLICQIRNTQQDKEGNENDFILSPVEPFFDSRKSKDFGGNLPKNGDDNGAYNIARKGMIILNKISEFKDKNGSTEKMKWDDLYISHVDWDNFAAG